MGSKFFKENLVTAVDGNKYPKNKCRQIQKKFYLIGDRMVDKSGQVFFFEEAGEKGKWYRNDTGYIIFDNRQGMYVLKNTLEVIVEDGVIGFDDKNEPIFGSFSQNPEHPSSTILVHKDKEYICISLDIAEKAKQYKECIADGKFYHRKAIPAIQFTEPALCSQQFKQGLPYDSKGRMGDLIKFHEKVYKANPTKNVEKYAQGLGDLSFGLEFETTKGVIPQHTSDRLGLMPLRDGSIKGLEYVTIPLKGKDGLQCLIDSLKELKKRTRYNDTCALHIHIGGMPRTEQFLVALFKVLFVLQEEIYSLFPLYKERQCGIKRKAYTKPLPLTEFLKLDSKIQTAKEIQTNFASLFEFLSMGQSFVAYDNDLNNVVKHPSDPNGTSKWNIKTRYHWVNLIPIIFGNKKTVEFRIHTPTYDINKIINFLFLCTSIINFTIRNEKKILNSNGFISNLTLYNVVSYAMRYTFKGQKTTSQRRAADRMTENIYGYLNRRSKYFIGALKAGELNPNEDDFRVSPMINWADMTRASDLQEYLKVKDFGLDVSPGKDKVLWKKLQELGNIEPGHPIELQDEIVHALQADIAVANIADAPAPIIGDGIVEQMQNAENNG